MDKKRKNYITVPSECLDIVEAAHRDTLYPLMYCHMKLTGSFDLKRLTDAVYLSSQFRSQT